MEVKRLIVGDVIRLNHFGNLSAYYHGCIGRVVKIGPQAQRIVEVCINDEYEQIAIPAGKMDNIEIIYRAPRDTDIVKEWADWDKDDAPDGDSIREVTSSGDTRWNQAADEIDKEAESILNPEYSSREEAAEDIFADKTAERLRALREKYHIPEPDKDIVDALEKLDS